MFTNTDLVIHTDADHAGLAEAAHHGRGVRAAEELEPGDEGGVRVADTLDARQVERGVDIHYALDNYNLE